MASDFYKILGVETNATPEEIKRSYRRLVRENHPDVAPDKTAAHARMQEILLAWSTLSDIGRRARYDLDQMQLERRAEAARPAPTNGIVPAGQAPPRATIAQTPRSSPPIDPKEQNRKRARVQQAMGGATGGRAVNPRTRLLTMVFDAAQLYYVEGRSEEAIRVINQVLRADPTNAEAAVLLGDIHAQQNNKSMALSMYERAVRLQPANLLYRQKLEGLRHPNRDENTAPSSFAGVNPWAKTPERQSLNDRIEQAADTGGETTTAEVEASRLDLLRATRAAVEAPGATQTAGNSSDGEDVVSRDTASAPLVEAEPKVVDQPAPSPAGRASLLGKLRLRWGK